MILKKGCPRCRGDMNRVNDIDGVYFSCLQCGHLAYPTSPSPVGRPAA